MRGKWRRVGKEDGVWGGGHNTTQQQYNTTLTKLQTQKTQTKIITFSNNTQTPPWALWEIEIEQEGARLGEAKTEVESLVIRN